ncbi:family 78 glycoside hydrolase catalytic domain [Microbacterium saperdae]|nr:family 78 glycoside hydrolase catalytic domain [Microbacterium saperdae]
MQRVDGGAPEAAHQAGARRPLLAGSAHPTLSWSPALGRVTVVVTDAEHDPRSVSSEVLERTVTAHSSIQVSRALQPFRRYRWAVQASAGWSEVQEFECGPLVAEDWQAAWVRSDGPATALSLSFTADSGTTNVRLHFAAQGLVSVLLNGRPVNPGALEPARAAPTRAWYRTYDLDDMVAEGLNHLVLRLGEGDWAHTGLFPRVRAEIVADGNGPIPIRLGATSAETAPTASPVFVDEPFFLEGLNLRNAGAVGTVITVDDEATMLPGTVTPDLAPTVREVRRTTARLVHRTDDAHVFDAFENVAGRARITVRRAEARDGQRLRVVHSEHLRDGRADTTNLSLPADAGRGRQIVEYILDGSAVVTLEPLFAIHGFRYVDITGLDAHDEVTVEAVVIHSDLPTAGRISTDDNVIRRLMEVADRTAKNTLHGIPEDCPTREQAGWTGDAAAVADFTFAAYDLDTFAAKWITDIRDSQRPDGSIPAVAPDVRTERFDTDPVWGSALVRMASGHLLWSGRRDVARDALPSLRRWVDYLAGLRNERGLVTGAPVSYGHDWLGLEQTPPEILHTASVIEQAEAVAALENEVGDHALAQKLDDLAGSLRASFRDAFVRRDDRGLQVGPSTQGSFAAAVAAQVLNADEHEEALRRIESDIITRGFRVSTGYAATRWLIDALGNGRRQDLVYRILQQPDEPGVGAMLKASHGTFWECWWVDPKNTGTGSLDHIGLGGVFAAWVWRWVVGMQPQAPEARRLRIRPSLPHAARRVSATRALPGGNVRIDLHRRSDAVELCLVVPPGVECELEHPNGDAEALSEGTHQRTLRGESSRSLPPTAADDALKHQWLGYPEASTAADEDGALFVPVDSMVDGDGTPAVIRTESLRCMPVPHAQQSTIWAVLPGADEGASRALSTRVLPDLPWRAAFVFAWLDLCSATYSRAHRAAITVVGERGSHRHGEASLWPAGANRVTCDLDGWPDDERIEHIDVAFFPAAGMPGPQHAPIHVGRVGISGRTRSW